MKNLAISFIVAQKFDTHLEKSTSLLDTGNSFSKSKVFDYERDDNFNHDVNVDGDKQKGQNTSELQERYDTTICGALHDLVLFVQFKKREKYPWRSVTFSKVAG